VQYKDEAMSKRTGRGIQYVEHTEGDGREMFKAVCKLGLEGIGSKKLGAPYSPDQQRRG
jgi:ATP-dependent DNA ligase